MEPEQIITDLGTVIDGPSMNIVNIRKRLMITNKILRKKNVKSHEPTPPLKEKQSERLSIVTKKMSKRCKNFYHYTKTQYLIARKVNKILIAMFMIMVLMSMMRKGKSISPHMLGRKSRVVIRMAQEKKLFQKEHPQ